LTGLQDKKDKKFCLKENTDRQDKRKKEEYIFRKTGEYK